MRRFLRSTFLWVIITPPAIMAVGALSNQLVLWVNHGTFPVMVNAAKLDAFSDGSKPLADGTQMLDETHCVMTKHTRLNWLADVFDWGSEIESVGDLFIDLGAWLWVFAPGAWFLLVLLELGKKTYA